VLQDIAVIGAIGTFAFVFALFRFKGAEIVPAWWWLASAAVLGIVWTPAAVSRPSVSDLPAVPLASRERAPQLVQGACWTMVPGVAPRTDAPTPRVASETSRAHNAPRMGKSLRCFSTPGWGCRELELVVDGVGTSVTTTDEPGGCGVEGGNAWTLLRPRWAVSWRNAITQKRNTAVEESLVTLAEMMLVSQECPNKEDDCPES
jgi:hypothetical protein